MPRVILAGFIAGLAAAVGAAQLADAGVIERIRIADPARRAHGLPPGLTIELGSPPDYARGDSTAESGRWNGPRYQLRSDPAIGGTSIIDWSVRFDEQPAPNTEQVVIRNIREKNWTRDQRGGVSIDHVVGGRLIGTLPGDYYLMVPGGSDARVEGVLAFPLGESLYAVVHLDLTEPPSDAYVVKGSIAGSTWNRGQALVAMNGIRLQGNLAPKIVGARAMEKGRRVKGKVVDRFLDPVVGAPVQLERQSGSSWTRVARGKTDRGGFYSLRAGRRTAYRVTVNVGGFRAESRPIVAGRGRR